MIWRSGRSLAERAAALGIIDERVLEAMRTVPRAGFVAPESRASAERDIPLPIPHGQTTSQPTLIARVVEALELVERDRVLEVGTGYGYQTALLAKLAAEVFSIDRYCDLVDTARHNLDRQLITNVSLRCGDGTEGWPEHASYDAIVVSAAFPTVPPPLGAQLAEGGRLIQPLGPAVANDLVRFRKRKGTLERDLLLGTARYVPLRGRYGAGDEDESAEAVQGPVPGPEL